MKDTMTFGEWRNGESKNSFAFQNGDPATVKDSLPMSAIGEKMGAQEAGGHTEVSSLKKLPVSLCLKLEP